MTPEKAREKKCPMAYSHPETMGAQCVADRCAAWEWTDSRWEIDPDTNQGGVVNVKGRCGFVHPLLSLVRQG